MSQTDLTRALQVDEVSTRFEEELRQNGSPRIETYLEDCPPDIRAGVLEELISLELWYARERDGAASIRDYLQRFPQHEAIVRECFAKDALPLSPAPVNLRSTANSSEAESWDSRVARKLADDTSFMLPEQFGRYRILERLGEGGMGSVYLAEDRELDRRIALKVPRLSRSAGSGVLNRFRREAQAAARIVHPNLCPVYDIGEIDGIFYLTMAYIEGQSLAHHIEQRRPVNVGGSMALVRKIAQALAEAHAQGVIHRDLKPSNIMINSRGEPVVVDFGLARTDVSGAARLTATGAIIGTPAYASPEQIEGEDEIDTRTDIYSLGIILYELLTSRLPFQGSSPVVLLQQILSKTPPPPSSIRPHVPKELDAICLKAISKRPEDRYSSMRDFDKAIAEWQEQSGIAEDGRPDWFRPTVITTPSQLGEAPRPAENESPQAQTPSAWQDGLKSRWQEAASRIKRSRPSVEQALWVATCAVLILCGVLLSDHGKETEEPPLMAAAGADQNGGIDEVEPAKPVSQGNRRPFTQKRISEPPPEPTTRISSPAPDPPEFRVQMPIPKGGWTKLRGELWHAGLADNDPLQFKIYLRCVDNCEIQGRACQVLEFDVTTLNNKHQEQASLAVDVEKYRIDGEVEIREGWILAPKDQVFARFHPEVDALALEYAHQGLKSLPEHRLSVQDVLALLFKAETNVKTTNDIYGTMHSKLRSERMLKDQALKVLAPEEIGSVYTLVEAREQEEGRELPVEYSIELCTDPQKIPFTWGSAAITYQPLSQVVFRAAMERERGGIAAGEDVAVLMSPDWKFDDVPAIPRNEFAYLSLPTEPGAWCRYEVKLLVPLISDEAFFKLNRVEVRALDREMVDNVPYRWMEVEVQTGEDNVPNKIVETVRLLVNEEVYRNERKFEFLRDKHHHHYQAAAQLRIGNKEPLFVRFDPHEDRMAKYHKEDMARYLTEVNEKLANKPLTEGTRLPIRNVLSLLFGAELSPHFLPFNIRTHISFALADSQLRRYYNYDKTVTIPEQSLNCILVRPGRSVSVERGNNLPPTTLDYSIFISQEPETFAFRWVRLELDLFEELDDRPGDRIFGGDVKLRGFGGGAKSGMAKPTEWIVKTGDPGEAEAYKKSEFYFKWAKKSDKASAIEKYQAFIDLCPNTLAAYEAEAEIEKLKK